MVNTRGPIGRAIGVPSGIQAAEWPRMAEAWGCALGPILPLRVLLGVRLAEDGRSLGLCPGPDSATLRGAVGGAALAELSAGLFPPYCRCGGAWSGGSTCSRPTRRRRWRA